MTHNGETSPMETRKHEEMEFHDVRERDRLTMTDAEYQAKYSNKKWYATTEKSKVYFDEWVTSNAAGRTVLDYCCGLGGTSLQFAQAGAFVHGIDISPESVSTARHTLKAAGLEHRGQFEVMDAENMTYRDDMFDLIVCSGVLHHLDASRAFRELARVLKPTGTIVAIEALGYNPVIATYRRLTPHLRTGWEADHILTMKELKVARQYFSEVEVHFFHLFSILATPLRKSAIFRPVLALMNAIEGVILKIPGVRLMAWQMIFFLRAPKR